MGMQRHRYAVVQAWAGAVVGLFAMAMARATDGLEPIGVSMQANARGGADVAVGDTSLSQVENPATLSFLGGSLWHADITGQLGFPVVTWRGPLQTDESRTHFIPLASLGVAPPSDGRWTWGLALHSKAGLGTQYSMRHLLIPFMERDVGGDMKCVDLQANASYRVNDRLAIAGGVRAEVAQTEFSMVLGPADVDFSRARAYGGGFQLGALYKLRPDVNLGLSYRSPTWMTDFEGARADAALLGVLPISLGEAQITNFTLPQRLAAGVAWDVDPKLRLSGEVRWFNCSSSSINSTTLATDGLIDLRYTLPLGYRDQWAFMAGAEYRLSRRWVLSGGYHFATAPLEPENLLPMGSTLSQHHVTAGLRYETDRWWAGVGYVLGLPTTLRGNGATHIPLGIDYAFSEIEQTQHIVQIGFGFRW